jgi:hypothetical protein
VFKELLYNHLLTNSTEQNPSRKANESSGSQKLFRTLRNAKVHSYAHKILQRVTNLRHTSPVHAQPQYILMIHFIFIIPSRSRSSKRSLCLGFLIKLLCISPFPNTCCVPSPSHFIDEIARIKFGEHFRS